MTHLVDIVTVPEAVAAVVRFHVAAEELPHIGERMGEAFGAVMAQLGAAQLTPVGPAFSSYRPVADGFDVAAGFRVPPASTVPPGLERLELEGSETAHTTHVGPYETLSSAYDDLVAQAGAAGRSVRTGGPMWEEYWSAPDAPADERRTEIYWPLEPLA
ncbi:hypothetical protein GCM10009798_40170 [Nocardioides panacihumi]|uniref:AraC effector-binding domain-containing protein n=1 Tax=Nocardioides panacihumi TaxID=400774 RepID=A0ABN2RTZ7_9ACTN